MLAKLIRMPQRVVGWCQKVISANDYTQPLLRSPGPTSCKWALWRLYLVLSSWNVCKNMHRSPHLRVICKLHEFTLAWPITWWTGKRVKPNVCNCSDFSAWDEFVGPCVTVNGALHLQWWKLLSGQIARSQKNYTLPGQSETNDAQQSDKLSQYLWKLNKINTGTRIFLSAFNSGQVLFRSNMLLTRILKRVEGYYPMFNANEDIYVKKMLHLVLELWVLFLVINKLAKHRRHASRIHSAKIHFG